VQLSNFALVETKWITVRVFVKSQRWLKFMAGGVSEKPASSRNFWRGVSEKPASSQYLCQGVRENPASSRFMAGCSRKAGV
jgi:hypothetical protein